MVIVMRDRNYRGQFVNKSDGDRQVRSIRVTDDIWREFGEMADGENLTRADLLEKMVKSDSTIPNNDQVITILQEALKLKANAGGAIKKKIREVLLILSE